MQTLWNWLRRKLGIDIDAIAAHDECILTGRDSRTYTNQQTQKLAAQVGATRGRIAILEASHLKDIAEVNTKNADLEKIIIELSARVNILESQRSHEKQIRRAATASDFRRTIDEEGLPNVTQN